MKQLIFIVTCLILFQNCDSKKEKSKQNSPGISSYTYLEDLDGNGIDISVYEGKKVLVNFWATWCGPCKKEMPDLLAAQEILSDQNYVFLLVSDESTEKIEEFKKSSGYKFNFLKSNKSFSSEGIYVLPTTFVYNDKGVLAEKITGVVSWNSEEMIHKLKNI